MGHRCRLEEWKAQQQMVKDKWGNEWHKGSGSGMENGKGGAGRDSTVLWPA